jgi:hypothetical protein
MQRTPTSSLAELGPDVSKEVDHAGVDRPSTELIVALLGSSESDVRTHPAYRGLDTRLSRAR